MTSELFDRIRTALPGLALRQEEPMQEHCSFRIGGCAELFAEPASEAQLLQLICLLKAEGIPCFILGRGTNLLISDEGIPGAVIKLGGEFLEASADGCTITAGAGIRLSQLAQLACRNGLTGLEFAHGIPGTLGGAVVMNAGAYGGEMKDVITSVRCLDPDGQIREYAASALDFSYRHSRFSDENAVILSARLMLTPGCPAEIEAQMRTLMEKRSASQPLDKASAGSTFKRPATGYAAAMIDGAGLRGYTVGGAQVSEKHAGFVVNNGNACFDDVCAVMQHVQETVFRQYGIKLEPEVKIIGAQRNSVWSF